MSFWSGETLERRLPSLISAFNPRDIDCNAYTLRLGSNCYCTSDGKRSLSRRAKKQVLNPGETFVIPPGQFAFIETRQTIQIPADAMAFISIKAKIKFSGLINVSGFHVDPGYYGRLLFSVYNAGPRPIILEEGMPMFLIWYAYLDNPEITVGYPSRKLRQPDSGKSIDPEILRDNSGEVLSLHGLSKEISRLSTRTDTIFAVGAGLVSLIILVAAGIITFIIQDKIEDIFHRHSATTAPSAISAPAPGLNNKNQ